MDEVELKDKSLGMETQKVREGVYISSGCKKCKHDRIADWCITCGNVYFKKFTQNNSYHDADITLIELYEFLASKDDEFLEDLEFIKKNYTD